MAAVVVAAWPQHLEWGAGLGGAGWDVGRQVGSVEIDRAEIGRRSCGRCWRFARWFGTLVETL
jgi:hypothetical protein